MFQLQTINAGSVRSFYIKIGEIIIRIVKGTDYSEVEERLLIKETYSKISPKLKVKFEYVNEIEREQTGKFRAVKSYL